MKESKKLAIMELEARVAPVCIEPIHGNFDGCRPYPGTEAQKNAAPQALENSADAAILNRFVIL